MGINKKLVEDYLHDIAVLGSIEGKLDSFKIEEIKSRLRTDNAKRYIESIGIAKPEFLLSEFLFRPLLDHLGLEWAPEIRLDKRGWVDYLIKTGTTVELAFKLLYREDAYDEMTKELGIKAKEITDEDEHREIRAELEAIIAKDVFGLMKGKWTTFS